MILKRLLDGHNKPCRGQDDGGGGGGGGSNGPTKVPPANSGPPPPGISNPNPAPSNVTINMGSTNVAGGAFTVPIPFGSYSLFGGRLTAFGTYSQQQYSSYNTMCTILGATNPGAGGSNGTQALANKVYSQQSTGGGTLHGGSIMCRYDYSGANYDFSIQLDAAFQQTMGGNNFYVGLSATFSF